LVDLFHAGLCGSVDALAQRTGWPPEHVRVAIKELRRSGEVSMVGVSKHGSGRGAPSGVYGGDPVGSGGKHLSDVIRGWAVI
jgi:hypothetical protein